MAVKFADTSDIPRIFEMVCRLQRKIHGPIKPEYQAVSESLMLLMASPSGVVMTTHGGFIAATIAPVMIAREKLAIEAGWYSEDGTGLRLLGALEAWAGDRGARVRLSTETLDQTPVALRKALARRGYRPFETAWIN